jgi:hypothetical protein
VTVIINTGAGEERFDFYGVDVGSVDLRGFGFAGYVMHTGHRHLIGGSAVPIENYLWLNISDQTGSIYEPYPPGSYPACDPGINIIELFDASVKTVLTVVVDIKPGTFPNPINPKARGVIPVAIITTAAFDALTVDPLTVKLGTGGAVEAHGKGHPEDVNGDGQLDLLLHFETQESGIKAGDVSAGLTGKTFAGQAIEGSDAIVTVRGGVKNALAQDTPLEQSTEGLESKPLGVRAYPNPFNPSTVVEFSLPKADFISLKV